MKEVGMVMLAYMKDRRKSFLLFLVCSGIFLLVFYLEELPLDAVGYGVLLCSSLCFLIFLADVCRYYKRDRRLRLLRGNPLVDLKDVPEAETLLEEDWRQLLLEEYKYRKKLEEANMEARQEMVDYYTIWAHQIKTPIAAMELLLSEDSSRDRELKEELFRVEQYVGMVLSYLRLKSDTSDYVIRRYPLERIVRQAVRKYAHLFIRKKIRLEFGRIEESVLTDEKWLSFVIEQLLSNALKYTNEGKIAIYMEREKTLVIEDTGIGIAPEDLPRICERGFTGYNGRTDKSSTGIGLYLCKEIMDKLSHRLTIISQPGKGTQVRLGLDLAEMRLE